MEDEKKTSPEDSNPCPICLGPFLQDSYLDRCFHKFCYNCIVRWTAVVASKNSRSLSSVKCPLCKTENFSVVYGYDGSSFQQHYINKDAEDSFFFSKAHKYRLQCYYTEPGILNDKFNITLYWKSSKYLQPNRWLQSWLTREIQALIQEENVDVIMYHILGVIDSFCKRNEQKSPRITPEAKQEEFEALVSDAARPFLMGQTVRFLNEIQLFLASELNVEAYDDVYLQYLALNSPQLTGEAAMRETHDENSRQVPYFYFFDDDSDGAD